MDVPIPRTVIRHSIPHIPSPTQFKATVYYRSAACDMIVDKSKPCDPCKTVEKQLRKVAKKRAKASPAKSKAPLAACGPGKLRATVVASSANSLRKDLSNCRKGLLSKAYQLTSL